MSALIRAGGVGMLGGTFDPVHYGHLRLADDVRTALELSEVRLVPAGNPYHRHNVVASSAQRLAMAQLAVAEFPGLQVDPREAIRSTPSYTVETLASLRAELGERSILLLLGADAFVTISGWKRWPELFELAHLVIVARPGYAMPAPLPPALEAAWADRITTDRHLLSTPAGHIYVQSVRPQSISATRIRAMVRAGERPDGLLPAAVVAYIESNSLYR